MKWEPIDISATANVPDEDTLTTQASAIKTKTQSFSNHFTDLHTTWNGLSGIYHAPAQQQVLTAMNTPKTAAEDLVDSATSIKNALDDFATAVGDIQTKHTALVGDIDDAKARFKDIYDAQVAQLIRAPLIRRASALATDYTTARKTCVTALQKVKRVTTDVTSHYAAGVLDLVSNDAERLQKAASRQDSTPAQVRAYYAYLAKMSPEEIATFAQEYPEAMAYGPRTSMPAREQVDFWKGLTGAQQTAIIASLPIIAGNTEGVSYTQRAKSNKKVLRMMLGGKFPVTKAQEKAYKSILESLKAPTTHDQKRHLISFDPSTDKPLAAVAIGNIDDASSVTFNASGITSKTQGMTGEVDNAQALWDQQGMYADGRQVVVAWIGYDSPGGFPASTEVNYTDKARVGGHELATQLDGLHLTLVQDGGTVPRINVGAHSYGTTMAAYALTQTEFKVDSVYFYGSAGLDPNVADSADDLHVKDAPNGRPAVYATQAKGDLVAPGGILSSAFGDVARISPTDDAFGAQVLYSESSVDGSGNPLKATTGHSGHGTYDGSHLSTPHNQVEAVKFLFDYAKGEAIGAYDTETGHGYLDANTTSLYNFAAVTTDQAQILDIHDQAISDTYIERAKNVYMAPTVAVDASQLVVNTTVDSHQSVFDRLQDSAVGAVNSGIDKGQSLVDAAGDTGKSLASGAADGARKAIPFGWGDSDVVKSLQDGSGKVLGGAYDLTHDAFNASVDDAQDRGRLLSDAAKWTRNTTIDGFQLVGNGSVDSAQRGVGVAVDSALAPEEVALRHWSDTHRDEPTR
ncbi:alpha/beta hydrolase [Arthrobacter sp.]|uniref:alpha/beta hydrolase n=1 Tax=Arthrobacter sp. TaxID=1667 RepID=UPI003A93F379